MLSLEGKTVIVTGGGSGIGEAISIKLANAQAHVNILDTSKDKALQTVSKIHASGGNAGYFCCDITEQKHVQEVVEEIGSCSTIDILINNAGIAQVGTIADTTDSDMDSLFAVNIKGAFHCMKAVIPFMQKKGGLILNMASVAASVGIADRFAYSMTKGAILAMTYSVAKDYIAHGIRCNSISPARIHTPFVDGFISRNYPGKEAQMFEVLSKSQPIGRMGRPDEVASLALYLCSDEASFITGTDFPIDGGFIRLNN